MRRNLVLLFAVLAVILSACQWLPLVRADWSIRDDYAFVAMMTDHGSMSFHDFLDQLSPENISLGTVANRPTYYFVHYLWMLLIGNQLPVWQLAKVVAYGLTIGFCAVFFALQTDLIAATLLTALIAFQPGWADEAWRYSEFWRPGIAGASLGGTPAEEDPLQGRVRIKRLRSSRFRLSRTL